MNGLGIKKIFKRAISRMIAQMLKRASGKTNILSIFKWFDIFKP
jgi:hypothetical protein